MPRIRTTKPEFWQDEKLAPMAPIDRLVFLGLISMADDAGRLLDNVKAIDGFIFPETDDTSRGSLDTLARVGRIHRYITASGQKLIQLTHWTKHQKVDKPSKYVLPGPADVTVDMAPVAPAPAKGSRKPRENVAKLSRSDLGPTTTDHRSSAASVAAVVEAEGFDFAPFAEAWFARYDGQCPAAPNVGPLKWLAKKHGAAETLRRWVIYLAATEAQYASAAKLKSGWGQWATPPVMVSRGGGLRIDTPAQAQAAALWARYREHNLLTRWEKPEYERIGALLVQAGHYETVETFLAELRVTRPWTLADARTDGYAITEIAARLAAPQKAAS